MAPTPVLIYDGDCGFCRQCLDWGLRNLTAFPAYLASQDARAKEFGLTEAELAAQVWLVGGGLRLGGASAVAYLLRMQPNLGWRILGVLMVAALPISNLIYKWVAKNRGKLGPKDCAL